MRFRCATCRYPLDHCQCDAKGPASPQALFEPPTDWKPAGCPPWFHAGKTAPASHVKNVFAGLHPFGLPLLKPIDPGKTCGTCEHRYSRQPGNRKVFHKCKLFEITAGPGTDLRLKWPGCVKWEATRPASACAAQSSSGQG